MLYLVAALLITIAGFAIGAFFYVAGSYLFARRHVPLPFGAFVREAFRELAWTFAVQPLLPLYYLVGHRMGRRRKPDDGPRRPVIFVHGYMQNRVGFVLLARELGRRGFFDLFGFNYPWWSSVGESSKRLARFVEKVCKDCGAERVDLVCHSMGGLVALEYIRTPEGAARVDRCATIASPHHGVKWRGPIIGRSAFALRRGVALGEGEAWTPPTKLLSIYSSNDNIVHPPVTSSLARFGGTDVEVGAMGHFAILFDRKTVRRIADFLDAA